MNEHIDFKIDKHTVVDPKTLKETFELCNFLDKLGATWGSGDKYTGSLYWTIYKANTCFDVYKGKYGDKYSYLEKGYDVISAEDFLKLHEKSILTRFFEKIKRIFRRNLD